MRHDDVEALLEKSGHFFDLTCAIMSGSNAPCSNDGSASLIPGRYEIVDQIGREGRAPVLSVIIPTFNRPDLLVRAVDTVCINRDVHFEIVIVNDGGMSIPQESLDPLRVARCRITVAQHHRNLGPGAARNTGVWLSRGRWIMMLDDDDTLVPGSLPALFRDHEEAAFIFGDHIRQWYDGDTPSGTESRSIGPEVLVDLCIENPILCGSFIVKRESFDAVRGYREDLPVHEDYNMHLRLLSSVPSKYLKTPLCVYHCRSGIPRINHRRLYWFSTSAFNHSLFRCFWRRTDDLGMKVTQRENQYAHLARAINEGCTVEIARSLVDRWWRSLRAHGLSEEIEIDERVISIVCPAIHNR